MSSTKEGDIEQPVLGERAGKESKDAWGPQELYPSLGKRDTKQNINNGRKEENLSSKGPVKHPTTRSSTKKGKAFEKNALRLGTVALA